MNLKKIALLAFITIVFLTNANAQVIEFIGKKFELVNVAASVETFKGEKVLKVERDLNKLPFDTARLESTVDEPTFVKLKDLDFENGTIEVKM